MGSDYRISRRRLLSALPLLPAARLLRAQNPSFSADVKVVNLFATVRDKKDQIVRDLTRDDFVLDEDGRRQTIRYFSQEANLPLTVGLTIDTSGSTRGVLPDELKASERFLNQVLRPEKDRAFIIHFDVEVELLQDLTGSRETLERALAELERPQPFGRQHQRGGGYPGGGGGYPGGGGGYPGPGGGQYPRGGGYPGGGRRGGRGAGGTALYDAVFLGSDEIMRKQSGRKALILLSDGEDNGSRETIRGALESAQRADTLVYTILFVDPAFEVPGFRRAAQRAGLELPDGRKVMQQLARESGARFFEVSRHMPIQKVFAIIEEDLRNQYSLGYSPDQTSGAGYRHIHLTTRQKGLLVQTRDGYYPA